MYGPSRSPASAKIGSTGAARGAAFRASTALGRTTTRVLRRQIVEARIAVARGERVENIVARMAKLNAMLRPARIGASMLPVPAAALPAAGSAKYPSTRFTIWAGSRNIAARRNARR